MQLKICLMAGRQAGIIGVLTVFARADKILSAVSYSEGLKDILRLLKVPLCKSVNDRSFVKKLKTSDVLLSVHGREIVGPELLKLPRLGCINIHPYLYRYKGGNPVGRAFKDREFNASVAAHIMESKVDSGKVLVERFVNVAGADSIDEIYNRLYPYYSLVILKALQKICRKCKKT